LNCQTNILPSLLAFGGESRGLSHSFDFLGRGGPLLHEDSMTTIRASNAAILVVDFHVFLASGALVGHLFRLQGLSYRPKDRTADGGVRYIGAPSKGVATFGAVPDGRACSANPVSSALRAIVQRFGLLFNIRYQLSGLPAVPGTKSGCRSALSSFFELLNHDYSSRNFSRIPLAFSHAISTMR
jgi:hypothetical protein